MDDCSCGIGGMMDARTVASSVWSPRSEGAVQEVMGYPGRLMLAPTSGTLPARHSKSLDQLGPDLVTSHQPPVSAVLSSPKTLPRSISTQLISSSNKHRQSGMVNANSSGRLNNPPATVPSRGKQRSQTPSCATLFSSKQHGKNTFFCLGFMLCFCNSVSLILR